MRRLLVTVAAGALLVGFLAPGATAAAQERHGWWWRAQTGLLGTQVPPPGVPEDGLAVEATPDGPSAVSALRYVLAEDESQPALVLQVAAAHGDLAITACGVTAHWEPRHGGAWDRRPTWDCGTAVEGTPSEDGATWRWELGSLLREGVLDVALVPAPGAGRVTFAPPDDASLETQRGGAGSADFSPPPVSEFAPPDASGGGAYPPAFDSGTGPSSRSGSFPAPGPAPDVAPAMETAGVPPPQAAPPAQAAPGQGVPPTTATLPATSGSATAVGAIIATLVGLVGFSLWSRGAPTGRGPRSTRRAAAVAEPGPGGLGRFARPRDGRPTPLL